MKKTIKTLAFIAGMAAVISSVSYATAVPYYLVRYVPLNLNATIYVDTNSVQYNSWSTNVAVSKTSGNPYTHTPGATVTNSVTTLNQQSRSYVSYPLTLPDYIAQINLHDNLNLPTNAVLAFDTYSGDFVLGAKTNFNRILIDLTGAGYAPTDTTPYTSDYYGNNYGLEYNTYYYTNFDTTRLDSGEVSSYTRTTQKTYTYLSSILYSVTRNPIAILDYGSYTNIGVGALVLNVSTNQTLNAYQFTLYGGWSFNGAYSLNNSLTNGIFSAAVAATYFGNLSSLSVTTNIDPYTVYEPEQGPCGTFNGPPIGVATNITYNYNYTKFAFVTGTLGGSITTNRIPVN